MDFTKAVVTIDGTAPYSQSRKHDDPWLEGEGPDDYDRRTWRSKMTVELIDGKPRMCIPSFAVHMALCEAARYSKIQIKGQGKATWTAKMRSGVSILGPISLGIDPAKVECIVLSLNSDGKRGSGSRVTRRLPQIPMGWQVTFEALILDPIITKNIFREMIELTGLYIGLGQYRPEKGGSNGRFILKKLEWIDNRQKLAAD
jgi:hypothetical protein